MRPEPADGEDAETKSRIAGYDWWHAIEVAAGVVTPGGWDLRPTAERMPWPGPLTGLRCLDVGTMDGFWAFEMERRGAAEVVAVDLLDPGWQDAPPRPGRSSGGPTRGETFRVAAELLGSRPPCWTATSTTSIRPTSGGSIWSRWATSCRCSATHCAGSRRYGGSVWDI